MNVCKWLLHLFVHIATLPYLQNGLLPCLAKIFACPFDKFVLTPENCLVGAYMGGWALARNFMVNANQQCKILGFFLLQKRLCVINEKKKTEAM